MAEVEKKGIGKAKVGLVVSVILIVILSATNIWFYTSLQNQIDTPKPPQLIKINLEERDVRSGTPYLRVQCVVVNVGNDAVNNAKLHVILYQGSAIAKETDIILGSISGENWKSIDEKIYYTGSALTNWSVMPEWSATP